MTSPMSAGTDSDCCTTRGLEDLEEFDDAHTLNRAYCKQVSEDQFEEQAVAETEKALTDLMKYIDCNKDEFTDFLRKKKKQDLENGGIFSFVKVKVMDMIHGDNSPLVRVSDKERDKKLDKMKHNMQKALDYTLETKGRRYSTRLQEKRKAQIDVTVKPLGSKKTKGSSAQGPPPPPPPPLLPEDMPPPPPPPPPFLDATPKFCRNSLARKPLMSIESRMNGQTPKSLQKGGSYGLNDSLGSIPSLNCSLTSLHQELLSSNPWKRLKCVDENKSPGGTPGPAKRSLQMGTPSSVSHQPLYQALFTNIQEKFRNARSPSPSPLNLSQNASYITSPHGFTP